MYNKGDKAPATWTLVREQGINRLYQSGGGAVKITRETPEGEERLVLMLPARQFETVAMVTDFINECAPHVVRTVKTFKDNKDKEKIKLQSQILAARALETLKGMGLTQEQINDAILSASKVA